MEEERVALQRVSVVKFANVHQHSAFVIIRCIHTHCILYVQLVSRLLQKLFRFLSRSNYLKVIDVPPAFVVPEDSNR